MGKTKKMLNERDQHLLELFAVRVRERFPEARVWAYGSRARGDHQEDSDLDLCVVIDRDDDETRRTVSRIAWEIGFEHDVIMVPLLFTDEEFDHGPCSSSSIVRVIKREGLAA